MEQVVVSAGEPVAWRIDGDHRGLIASWHTGSADAAAEAEAAGCTVTEFFASAPVVLPEEPPEGFTAEVGDDTLARFDSLNDDIVRATYAAVRAWVAGGGETR